MKSFHPGWDDEQIEMQMGNFESLPDSTIRPWLTLERHMAILRAMWEQKPIATAQRVAAPVLIAVADTPDEQRRHRREEELERLRSALSRVEVKHFEGAHHDIHVDCPVELADWILDAAGRGFFD